MTNSFPSTLEPQAQLLFIKDLERMLSRDRLTLRRWWTTGKFPLPVKLHGSTLAWHRDAVETWITQNFSGVNHHE